MLHCSLRWLEVCESRKALQEKDKDVCEFKLADGEAAQVRPLKNCTTRHGFYSVHIDCFAPRAGQLKSWKALAVTLTILNFKLSGMDTATFAVWL